MGMEVGRLVPFYGMRVMKTGVGLIRYGYPVHRILTELTTLQP